MKKTILILSFFILISCSVEYKITKQCDIAATFVDTKEGSAIFCVKCDSLKSDLVKKIQKKFNNENKK